MPAPEPRTPTLCIPIESRASVQAKAVQIILERRLLILAVRGDRVWAEVRGSDRIYHPCYVKGQWNCDCDARGKCSHLAALKYVTVRPED